MDLYRALLAMIPVWAWILDLSGNGGSNTLQKQAKDAKILFLVEWWSTTEEAKSCEGMSLHIILIVWPIGF